MAKTGQAAPQGTGQVSGLGTGQLQHQHSTYFVLHTEVDPVDLHDWPLHRAPGAAQGAAQHCCSTSLS
ncbi:hypothetical protein HaLaN_27110 [Haematococcus lacustris]|uniref:Uncharacterized protein n=1 Tax=Haematococcus lacustris TaxID=44745 RepID=A0A6A0A8T3_HAELA|nr:hypothetical protein HaLaN_27110 [Haematococcus lacustris]